MAEKSAVNQTGINLLIPPEIALLTVFVAPSKITSENAAIGKHILQVASASIGTNPKQINLKDLRVISSPDPETCNAAREVARTINPRVQIIPSEDLVRYSFPLAYRHLFSPKVAVMVMKDDDCAEFFEDFQSTINWPLKHATLGCENDVICAVIRDGSVSFNFY